MGLTAKSRQQGAPGRAWDPGQAWLREVGTPPLGATEAESLRGKSMNASVLSHTDSTEPCHTLPGLCPHCRPWPHPADDEAEAVGLSKGCNRPSSPCSAPSPAAQGSMVDRWLSQGT